MVIEKVRNTIINKSLIEKGEHIVAGVSGGPDSVCLLHVLHRLSEEFGLSLYAVHINHCLRGNDADMDQAYTESLCGGLRIPCRVFKYDVKSMAADEGLTTEEMGREVRYRAFDQVRKEIILSLRKRGIKPAVKIAVAQNLNDQAETVLMRIIRGTGTDGLAAMEYIRDGIIIRPLLDVTRKEIEEYCSRNGLSPRIDLTNLEPLYTRNKVRLELIPFLKENYNENILSALNRLIQIATEDKEFIYSYVDEAIASITVKTGDSSIIDRGAFRNLHPSVSKRVIVRVFKDMGLIQDIAAVHLEQGDRMIRSGRTGEQMDFPRGYRLRISYNEAVLLSNPTTGTVSKDVGKADFCHRINLNGITQIPALNAHIGVTIKNADQIKPMDFKNPYNAYLEYSEKVSNGILYVRSRRPGDFIKPFGMEGSKKLQDFFVDEKISREERDRIPLVCIGSEVLWVVGRRINEDYKVRKDTDRIVCLEYIPSI